ncbi:hypothetical protein K2W90_02430 [Candidatus Babeliales bacterium]|nr:hypothetical protein [Candidatus Babeliales bacterium]
MFKKITLFSLLFFASYSLHGAASSEKTDVTQCSIVIKSGYICALREFIQNHLKGDTRVAVKLASPHCSVWYNVNKHALGYIVEFAASKILLRELKNRGLETKIMPPRRTTKEIGTAWQHYLNFVKKTTPAHHRHLDQKIIEDNFHKMLLYMLDEKIPTADEMLKAAEQLTSQRQLLDDGNNEEELREDNCWRCLFLAGLTAIGLYGAYHDHQE